MVTTPARTTRWRICDVKRGAVLASWALTALFALAVAASVYHIPIQVSDSLALIQQVDTIPSVGAAFAMGLRSSSTKLRPLREAQTRMLLNVAGMLGRGYHPAFRGFHALTAALLIAMFTLVVRPRTWVGFAALVFALTVLTGLHTFAGMMREAYPINHFLLVSLYCLTVLAMARSRGGLAPDLLAVACFVLAVLTLESGCLVWIVVAAGYVAGLRGVSRRALLAMTVLLAGYVLLRVGYLELSAPGLGEHATGWWTGSVSADEQLTRFGDAPLRLYVYTAISSALSVLLSQPTSGQWTALAAWQANRFRPVNVIEIGTSAAATALCIWFLLSRTAPNGPRRWREPLPFVALVVLAVNAAMCYAYAKDEIMSTAGVFYAALVFCAAVEALNGVRRRSLGWVSIPLLTLALLGSGAWAFRSLGLHYKLLHGAYDSRTEWILRMPPHRALEITGRASLELADRLRQEALARGRGNPRMLPRWMMAYWGDD